MLIDCLIKICGHFIESLLVVAIMVRKGSLVTCGPLLQLQLPLDVWLLLWLNPNRGACGRWFRLGWWDESLDIHITLLLIKV